MNITLKQLRSFCAVARHGNLGAAAEALFLSRGAISQALQELERQLGTPLFDRVHPRLQLNSEGRLLHPLAEDLLARLHDIEGLFGQEGSEAGLLRLGASQTIGNYLLPTLIAPLHHEAGRLEVVITNSHNLCQLLANFELDLALIEGECLHDELVTEPWLEDEMVVIAPPAHPLATRRGLDITALNGERWVLRESYSGSRERFDLQIRPHLERLDQGLELNTLEAVMLSVERGLGLSFISELAARDRLHSGRLVRIDLSQRFPRRLTLVWHRQKYLSRAMQRFIAFCQAQREQAQP
ncbi:LysR family transcriptional regulator [Aeromonas diversa CDC 2478-85]|uniref:LysR family transcriptional regulator n=1 Tax=Aeromonas diversa CDC 2478-85 TaxID=1268237 RepID=N9V9D3_9GAMM|nr:LysR substrate-binding domain-containing protein [Aeromonas diversa]ENY71892.1 LysR family transcriptional regulator [Aeromonas diversa CDC 2478-85]